MERGEGSATGDLRQGEVPRDRRESQGVPHQEAGGDREAEAEDKEEALHHQTPEGGGGGTPQQDKV